VLDRPPISNTYPRQILKGLLPFRLSISSYPPMSYTSNASTIRSHSRTDASSTPRNTRGTTSRPPLILTYCYGSQMVYVAPGDHYDRAINVAIESFQELRDIDRDRICLEVRVMHSHQRTVKIGRTAWPFLVATLARFDIVDVCIAPPPPSPRIVPASSSSDVESTPYDPETGWPKYSENAQTTYRPQMLSSLLQPHSHTTRVVVDVVPSWSPPR